MFPVGVGRSFLGGMPLDKTDAQVLDEEGKEDTGHKNGGGGGLVLELTQAFVAEHEDGMGEELGEFVSDVASGLVWKLRQTWMNAVEMMTPVPNCRRMVKTAFDGDTNEEMRIGVKTPRQLVTSITKRRPTRSLML